MLWLILKIADFSFKFEEKVRMLLREGEKLVCRTVKLGLNYVYKQSHSHTRADIFNSREGAGKWDERKRIQ